ncbi:FAD-binding and (Fe-S)-binding domain-containing protein [Pseudofrankia asymbiotica]|uniref:FAD-binding oxidoreductase n=1 Tax=Pseudofrankia asymbiotica TaxID=1834516 RepID=A0A1V2I4H3_9ACTN|nr:FAD-binding and (Fe-S)-binding domain-containing protein [Pseudofrankia asymbiotica]ONH25678.1 FAD-binding oxidoreductase [Pseudofrankia asymbiotica]
MSDPRELTGALARAGLREVDASARRRAEYSSDASNYRVMPAAVVFPRDGDEVAAALAVAREAGVPLTARGGGTSIAGNAIGSGIVLDFSRHMNQVLAVDPEGGTARVQPGAILDDVTAAAAAHGLRFGPDPSTHSRATIGGAIGNNACGSRAMRYGRTADNVVTLDLLTADGDRLTARAFGREGLSAAGAIGKNLEQVVSANLGLIRTEFGRFTRQVSGYSLEHLLPENGADLARFLVGTEGTLGVVVEATVRLVETPAAVALAVLGYEDMPTAAEAVGAVRPHAPVALEGMDARLVEVVRSRRGPAAVPDLPRGGGWLFVETAGATQAEAVEAARRLAADAGCLESAVVTGPAARALWRIREDGAGLGGRTPAGAPAWPGWEDAAVPPERLGAYLREFAALLAEHRLDGLMYGHFGDGCVHARIDFPFAYGQDPKPFREFMVAGARLVARHGGSVSGEHGDGRARSELLGHMYSPSAIATFGAVKHAFDPGNVLNPGVLVDPRPLDADLRVPLARPLRRGLAFAYSEDGGDLTTALHRCVGMGRCRADNTAAGGVMCPSFLATRDEKDSTRGRARVLQEVANGTLIGGFRAKEVEESLDLCLSCRGCATDCPTGVDMATYKAEALYQKYRHRPRPASHYSLGWLPRAARAAARAPRLANATLRRPALARLAKGLGGIDQRRDLPEFAAQTFRQWFARRPAPGAAVAAGAVATGVVGAADVADATGAGGDGGAEGAGGRGPVVLWVDTFTEHFSPEVGQAAVRVLESAGYEVRMPEGPACCGLTWISTGQLDTARRQLRRTLDALAPALDAGIPVIGLEPSCTAVLRRDVVELLPDDPRAARVAAATRTLAELLSATAGWAPPRLDGVRAVAQPHCHHHAVLGWDPDAALLAAAGAEVKAVGGCCGLAGNFGVEKGHYEVSVAVAETALLPAVRAAEPGGVVLADGFSCRTQLAQLAGVHGLHLAELLDRAPDADGAVARP